MFAIEHSRGELSTVSQRGMQTSLLGTRREGRQLQLSLELFVIVLSPFQILEFVLQFPLRAGDIQR